MSEYRDDIQVTMVAQEKTWVGLKQVVEEVISAGNEPKAFVRVDHGEALAVSEQVTEAWMHSMIERLLATEAVTDYLAARNAIIQALALRDSVTSVLKASHGDSVAIADSVTDKAILSMAEAIVLSDEASGQKFSRNQISQGMKIADLIFTVWTVEALEDLAVLDEITGKLKAKIKVTEYLTVSDESTGTIQLVQKITEQVKIFDEVTGSLHAADVVNESITVIDTTGTDTMAGMAWTANTDNWAMSTYEPYTFEQLAVIDGILYGVNDTGVYQLTGTESVEDIQATIETGKLDLSGGELAHPASAYLEYEKSDGTATMEVTTTQSGQAQSYLYPLADEEADELTNGRFIFGRGLRGRHFSFKLQINAKRGHVNDLSILTVPTKRRV